MPVTAQAWKNFWNKNKLWISNDSIPEHIGDAIFMGYYYLIKIEKLTVKEVKKLIKQLRKTNFNYYRYKGIWYYGKRLKSHSRGRRNSFGI